MLKLRLLRINKTQSYTEGVLINLNTGEVLCDTLEDVIRDINGDSDLLDDGEGKIYGETAIPYSPKNKPYKLKVTYSPTFLIDTVQILNVKHFTGIRFHWGATAKNSDGCPLCGKRNKPGRLLNTGMTKKLTDLLLAYGNEGTLEIL